MSDVVPFFHTVRVRYAETDAGGVAHHSSYVVWLEEARTEWMRSRGRSYGELEAGGQFLMVTALQVKYLSPARYDDELAISVQEESRKRASVDLTYELTHAGSGRRVATAMTRLACTDADGRVRRLPEI